MDFLTFFKEYGLAFFVGALVAVPVCVIVDKLQTMKFNGDFLAWASAWLMSRACGVPVVRDERKEIREEKPALVRDCEAASESGGDDDGGAESDGGSDAAATCESTAAACGGVAAATTAAAVL